MLNTSQTMANYGIYYFFYAVYTLFYATRVSVSAMQPFFKSLCLLPLLQHY